MEEKHLSPVKSIKAFCLDCSGDSAYEVKMCPRTDCPLYFYRLGHNTNRTNTKVYTDEEREAARKRLTEARARKKESKDS